MNLSHACVLKASVPLSLFVVSRTRTTPEPLAVSTQPPPDVPEPVPCLEAPEPAETPRALLRADGRSVYRRHGGVRYATRAQLSMDDALVAQAGAEGTPRLPRAAAAHLLHTDPERLVASL